MRRLVPVLVLAMALPASAVPTTAIPDEPGQGSVPAFEGAPVTANPLDSFAVPQHPFMAANGTSNIHNDAYMTDAYDVTGPLGNDTQVTSTWLGVEECASITFDSSRRIMALCGTGDGARLRLMDATTLSTMSVLPLPPRMARPGTTPLNDFCAAGYFYLDELDRSVLSTNTNEVWVVGERDGLLVPQQTYNLNAAVVQPDCIASVLPDWSGRLWFLTKGGVVGTLDPTTGAIHSVTLAGEGVFNSFAVDETGGVFIVTDHALYRFDAGAGGAPSITWRVPYDRGTRLKPGMLSQGSGTSPTLIGSDFVAIADNAEPRMNVEVYRRADGSLVCRTPVFASGKSATENSLIAVGTSLVVENNYGYVNPTTTAGGASTEPGIARVDFDPGSGSCTTAWENAEVSPTTVPKVSLGSGLVYVYAKPPRADRVDAWYFTAIDFRTGATTFRRLTGRGYLYNNHYAPVSIGPDGAAYVGALGGLIRIADRPA